MTKAQDAVLYTLAILAATSAPCHENVEGGEEAWNELVAAGLIVFEAGFWRLSRSGREVLHRPGDEGRTPPARPIQAEEAVADLHYISGYAKVLAEDIRVGVLRGSDCALARRMAELAGKSAEYVRQRLEEEKKK